MKIFESIITKVIAGVILTVIGKLVVIFGKPTMSIEKQIIIYLIIFIVLDLIYDIYRTWKYYNKRALIYDEIFKNFTNRLSYAIGSFNGYHSKIDSNDKKYTNAGVIERINEVRSARVQLLSVCGEPIQSILLEAGDDWLSIVNDLNKLT